MAHITLSQLTTVLQRIVSWATGKFAAKNTYSGKIEYADMPVVVLASMGIELDGTSTQRPMSAGSTYYLPAGQGAGARIMFVDSNGVAVKISNPESNVIYCNAYTGLLYRWDESESDMVPVGGDVDGLRKVYVGNNDFSSLDTLYSGVYQVIDEQSPQRIIGVLVASSDNKIGANPYFVTQWLFSNLVLSDEYSGSFNNYYITGRAHIIQRFYNASNPSSDIPLNTWSEWKVYGLTLDELSGLLNSKVSSVSVNGQTKTPDSRGNVDLGTIQGQPGAQGPAGNTYLVDENFDPVSMIINNLDESDGTVALSARQGKILKQNVEALWAKVNALISDLAAMAFTDTKTQGLGNIDWTGGTFYATVVKNLTGCTATDNTTNGQIVEGQTLTMQLTASSGFALTGATISVTNSKGQAVAYTLNGNTLSVANVTGTITVSVIAVGVFTVVNNDTNVNLTASTTSPTSGSSWTGTLSLKSGVTGYALSSNPSVTMGGVEVDFTASGNSWNRSTGAMTIGNVTGNIVILEAAVEVVAHTITKKLLNYTASDDGTSTTDADFGYKKKSVEDGDDYSVTLSLANSATSNNDLLVKMGGVALDTDNTKTSYYTFDSSNGALVVKNVTADVTIIATACTGVVTAKANTSGAKITITKTDNSTVELTCDTDNGDGTYSGTLNISGTVKSVAFTDKTAILEADFGGLITTDNIGGLDGNTGSPNTTIKKILGLVCTLSTIINERFKGCSALERIDTIGWSSNGYYTHSFMKGCSSLKAIDLSWLPLNNSNNSHREMFSNCTALSRIILADDLSGVTNPMGWCQNRSGDINTSTLVFSGGKLTNVTSLEDFARSCNFKKLDISFIDSDAITNMNSIFYGSRIDTLIIGNLGAGNLSDVTWVKAYAVNKLVCKSSTPPAVNPDKNWLTSLNVSNIYVPDASVNAYKAAAGWNAVTDRIHSINEYTE